MCGYQNNVSNADLDTGPGQVPSICPLLFTRRDLWQGLVAGTSSLGDKSLERTHGWTCRRDSPIW